MLAFLLDLIRALLISPHIFHNPSSVQMCCFKNRKREEKPFMWCMALLCMRAIVFSSASSQQVYTPPDSYFINCGVANHNVSVEGRQWQSDTSLISSHKNTIEASSSPLLLSPLAPLLATMRIFTKTTAYSFPVTPGRHWVRLYFFPFVYRSFDPSKALFSVTAGSYTLLSKSNISSTISSSHGAESYLLKEYSINVIEASLRITFIPSKQNSLPFAFINALEVVSMPSNLISEYVSPLGVGLPMAIGIPFMAMETMHRVNAGGPLVSPLNDTKGLFRTWLAGESFLISSEGVENISVALSSIVYTPLLSPIFAPPVVYSTALQIITPDTASPQSVNISWVFPVHADHMYVVRLHFCELEYGTGGKRTFNIYLQNQSAYSGLDLGEKLGRNVPFYVDFSLVISNDTNLWVQAGPAPNLESGIFSKAIVSGIEVWKLNDSQGGLDMFGDNSKTMLQSHEKLKAGAVVGAVIGIMVALGFAFVLIHYLRGGKFEVIKLSSSTWLPLPSQGGHSTSIRKSILLSGIGSYVSLAPSSLE